MKRAFVSLAIGTLGVSILALGASTPATAQTTPQAASIPVRPVTVAPSLRAALVGKKRYDPTKLATFIRTDSDGPVYRHANREYRLMETSATTKKASRATNIFPAKLASRVAEIKAWQPGMQMAGVKKADNRKWQSPVRDQLQRGTCSAFATVAAVEALWHRKTGLASEPTSAPTMVAASATPKAAPARPKLGIDLSENHLFMKALRSEGRSCLQKAGVPTWAAADMAMDGICAESAFPYTEVCEYSIPGTCASSATRKLNAFWPMYTPNHGVPDVQQDMSHRADNVALLEAFLDLDIDVIYAVDVAGTGWKSDVASTGVIDVELDAAGNPAPAYAAHAMLMVGYDRAGKYFVFKNSYGTDHGRSGYLHISYDYVQTYAWYAFAALD